jgi:hypothetical protein
VAYDSVPVVVDGVCESAFVAAPPRPIAPRALPIILWLLEAPVVSDVVDVCGTDD